jgi:hypothetical protein
MDGSLPGSHLIGRLTEQQADLDRMIAAEQARPAPDDVVVRRLMRERMLARDRLTTLTGSGTPAWARSGAVGK